MCKDQTAVRIDIWNEISYDDEYDPLIRLTAAF